jgi:hypothetical protein
MFSRYRLAWSNVALSHEPPFPNLMTSSRSMDPVRVAMSDFIIFVVIAPGRTHNQHKTLKAVVDLKVRPCMMGIAMLKTGEEQQGIYILCNRQHQS